MSGESLVYEDEILPEIEIRELLTLNEILAENPSFIAFTKNEITEHVLELLKDKRKAAAFTSAILESSSSQTVPQVPRNVVPIIHASVKETLFDEVEYADKLADIANAPNYNTQQEMLSGLAYPFQHVPPSNDQVGVRATDRPIQVGIDNSIAYISKLIPSDGVEEACDKAIYVVPTVTDESYLYERISNPNVPRVYSHQIHQISHISPLSSVRPEFNVVLDLLNEVPDLHGIKQHLSRYNYSFEQLNPQQLGSLVERLKVLTDSEGSQDIRNSRRNTAHSLWQNTLSHHDWSDFYDALKHLSAPSISKEKYSAIYDALMASIPPQMINTEIPIETHKILNGLYANSFTLDDVATFMRMTRNKVIVDNAFSTLQRYLETDPEAIPESIQHSIDKWMRRTTKYDDRTAEIFLEMYRDMAEVKKGNDTTAYDGNPFEQPDQVFQELQYTDNHNDYIETESDEENEIAPAIVEDDIDMKMFEGVEEGVREILIPVFRKVLKLSKLSGISINLDNLLSYIAPRIIRISFEQTLTQYVPELGSDVRLQLASGNYESAARIAANIVPVAVGQRAHEVVREMYKEYHSLLKATFLQCFSWYVLMTQEAALEKRLDFDPMSGMLSCIRAWMPYGAPVTKEKEPEGAIYYLACVAQESMILDDYKWTSDDLVKNSLAFMSSNMTDMVEELQKKWDAFSKENTLTVSKARQANLSLAEAIQMKLKKRILPDYVRAFLYIPGMLNATKHPQHAMGCCMQKLGQDFRADSDWQDLKKLKAVKDQFAKKRMTKTDPPHLAWLEKPIQKQKHDKNEPAKMHIPSPIAEPVNRSGVLNAWLDKCVENNLYLFPHDAIEAIRTDPTSLNSTISKNITVFLKTCNKKSAPIESYFGMNQMDMKKFLDIVATNLRTVRDIFDPSSTEHAYLTTSIYHVQHFKQLLNESPLTSDAIDSTSLQYIVRFAVSRAVCLPADPRDAGRVGKLNLTERVGATFLTNVLTQLYSRITGSLTSSHMPTADEQQAFITKMREIQKVQTLELYNQQSDEDRQIMMDAKKVGLFKVAIDYSGATSEETNAEANIEEEPEYTYRGEDPDGDDDAF